MTNEMTYREISHSKIFTNGHSWRVSQESKQTGSVTMRRSEQTEHWLGNYANPGYRFVRSIGKVFVPPRLEWWAQLLQIVSSGSQFHSRVHSAEISSMRNSGFIDRNTYLWAKRPVPSFIHWLTHSGRRSISHDVTTVHKIDTHCLPRLFRLCRVHHEFPRRHWQGRAQNSQYLKRDGQ
jgi:hypothetical protein